MATSSSVVDVSSFTTDAKFRTWGSAVSAAIVASGLTVTADTGQINWTTVTRPTGATTKAGYEIYRFNDTLQSTYPIFIRIDYGSGANASGQNPDTWLTVGTGSDGAGNITGVFFPVGISHNSTTASTNTTMTVRAAYSTSAGTAFIDAGLNEVANVNTGCWVISRTVDNTSGAPTGIGCSIVRISGTGVANPTQFPVCFQPYNVFTSRNCAVAYLTPNGGTTVSGGGVIELSRFWNTVPNPYGSVGLIGYWLTDIATGTVFQATPFGSTLHTYVALGQGIFEQAVNSASQVAAVIWE